MDDLTIPEQRALLATLQRELRQAEAALEATPEDSRAEFKVAVLRRATANVQLRMRAMDPGPLGNLAHSDLVSAAAAFVAAQLGPLGEREVVVRLAIGVSETRAFLLERSGEAYAEVGGREVADHGAFRALLDAAAGFVTTALNSIDQAKRVAIKQALDAGDVLGLDIHAGGLVTLLVARGTEAVVVAMVQPQTETAGSSAAH